MAAPSRAPQRSVVSFVRRTSKLPPKLQKAWDAYSQRFLLDLPAGQTGQLGVAADFRLDADYVEAQWGNRGPLIIEIGSGQGENIAAAALAEPDQNFLALEVYDPGVAHTLARIGKQGLTNLRIAQVDAVELFTRALAPRIAQEVWTYFPDPWPKMRHHKRRIVQPALAQAVHKALMPGGIWRIATDIDDYALHVHEVLDDPDSPVAKLFENLGTLQVSLPTQHVGKGNADETAANLPHALFQESERPPESLRVLTSFEKKGLAKGHTVHDFTYRRL